MLVTLLQCLMFELSISQFTLIQLVIKVIGLGKSYDAKIPIMLNRHPNYD